MHTCSSTILYAACTFRPNKSTPVLKLFRTFLEKMKRGLSLQMVFSPLFVETLWPVRKKIVYITFDTQLPTSRRIAHRRLSFNGEKKQRDLKSKWKAESQNKGDTVPPARRIPILSSPSVVVEKNGCCNAVITVARFLPLVHASAENIKDPFHERRGWLHQCDVLRNIVPVRMRGPTVLCRLLSRPLPSVCFLFFSFPIVFVLNLFWCNFLYYLVTTAGFVADQLIM